MERILVGVATTIQVNLTRGGLPADANPDAATVRIVAQDGTVTQDTTAAIDMGADQPGVYGITILPTRLDRLTATWTFTLDGASQTVTTQVEVVGGFLFNITELQALIPTGKSTQAITTVQIIAKRTLAEQALEDACGVAFVPRYRQETVDGTGTRDLMLSMPRVRSIRSVTDSGTAWTQPTIDALTYRPGGIVHSTTPWACGYGNLTVGYEHGYDVAPERVRQAALLLAKQWLLSSPIDSRATSMSNDDGTFALMTPGLRGALFGIPEVEATIQMYSLFTGVA